MSASLDIIQSEESAIASDAETKPTVVNGQTPRPRFEFLDGLRGLAALEVVLAHAKMVMTWNNVGTKLPGAWQVATMWMDWAHYAVGIFIVLSGFCLMLPVVRRADGELPDGIIVYIKRRACRILPPYYAALAISLLLIVMFPVLQHPTGRSSDFALPALQTDVVVSHLFLIHNLNPVWSSKINMPMWSIGTEWQIYFLFPLVLLPIWRRFNIVTSAAFAVALGIGCYFLGIGTGSGPQWYLGLFAMGMLGAVVCFPRTPLEHRLQTNFAWGRISAILFSVIVPLLIVKPGWCDRHNWIVDPVIGFATTCGIISCARYKQAGNKATCPLLLCVLENHHLVFLGLFSFSLYLIHYPILVIGYAMLYSRSYTPALNLLSMLFLVVPISIGISHCFHRVFERPAMGLLAANRNQTPSVS